MPRPYLSATLTLSADHVLAFHKVFDNLNRVRTEAQQAYYEQCKALLDGPNADLKAWEEREHSEENSESWVRDNFPRIYRYTAEEAVDNNARMAMYIVRERLSIPERPEIWLKALKQLTAFNLLVQCEELKGVPPQRLGFGMGKKDMDRSKPWCVQSVTDPEGTAVLKYDPDKLESLLTNCLEYFERIWESYQKVLDRKIPFGPEGKTSSRVEDMRLLVDGIRILDEHNPNGQILVVSRGIEDEFDFSWIPVSALCTTAGTYRQPAGNLSSNVSIGPSCPNTEVTGATSGNDGTLALTLSTTLPVASSLPPLEKVQTHETASGWRAWFNRP